MRKVLCILVVVLFVFSMATVGLAVGINTNSEPSNDPFSDFADSGWHNRISPRSSNLSISQWYNSVGRVNSGVINCYAYSAANKKADKLAVTFYLQRSKNNSSWENYYSTTKNISNRASYGFSFDKSIVGGYYYRIVTYHKTYSGTVCTSTESATSGSLYF